MYSDVFNGNMEKKSYRVEVLSGPRLSSERFTDFRIETTARVLARSHTRHSGGIASVSSVDQHGIMVAIGRAVEGRWIPACS